ncbi:MAG: hypothetical protein V4527_10625 [Pseudomonadota bacterium]
MHLAAGLFHFFAGEQGGISKTRFRCVLILRRAQDEEIGDGAEPYFLMLSLSKHGSHAPSPKREFFPTNAGFRVRARLAEAGLPPIMREGCREPRRSMQPIIISGSIPLFGEIVIAVIVLVGLFFFIRAYGRNGRL